MWYVIQTRTGAESELVKNLEEVLPPEEGRRFLIPMFQDVLRSGGVSRIRNRRIFPGYVLIDTKRPEDIISSRNRRRIYEFTRVLGADSEEVDKDIKPVDKDDAAFLESILENGVMSVSYVDLGKGTKIRRIIGPLAKYGNRITKIELRRRRAIVDAFVFGKQRKIKFGLWTAEDPELPWIKEALDSGNRPEYILESFDIGLRPGDKVRDLTGTYGDGVFTVEKVDPVRRTITTSILLFGELRHIELISDQVELLDSRDK